MIAKKPLLVFCFKFQATIVKKNSSNAEMNSLFGYMLSEVFSPSVINKTFRACMTW